MKIIKHFLVFVLIYTSQLSNAQDIDKTRALCTELETKFSVKIFIESFPLTSWKLDYQPAEPEDSSKLYAYLQLFDEEFSKYPVSFHKATNLKSVVFVKSLGINGQLRAAIPDCYKEILLFDFKRGDYNKTYQKHVIHHEYYHMTEEEFNNDAYWKDPQWNNLNITGIKYGSGGSSVQNNSNVYSYTHPEKGFVNLYSMSAIEEDKAEMFATLFIKSEYEKLMNWAKEDEVLEKKKNYMINFLCTKDSNFKQDYWINLHENQ